MTIRDWYVWIQPLDPAAQDVMSVNGHVLTPAEQSARERWIATVEATARVARRQLPGGGFVSRKDDIVVGQIPLARPTGQPAHTGVVALRTGSWTTDELKRVQATLTELGTGAGYEVDASTVRRGLEDVALSARNGCLWRRA